MMRMSQGRAAAMVRNADAGTWAVWTLASLMLLFGVMVFGGGLWLVTFGISPWYAVAGVGLLATSYFLYRLSFWAVAMYAVTWVGLVVATLMTHAGPQLWSQGVPHLVLPTLILAFVLLSTPVLLPEEGPSRVHVRSHVHSPLRRGG